LHKKTYSKSISNSGLTKLKVGQRFFPVPQVLSAECWWAKERLDKKREKGRGYLREKMVTRRTILYQSKLDGVKSSGLSNVPSGTFKKY
jgi:hypothetical protein